MGLFLVVWSLFSGVPLQFCILPGFHLVGGIVILLVTMLGLLVVIQSCGPILYVWGVFAIVVH